MPATPKTPIKPTRSLDETYISLVKDERVSQGNLTSAMPVINKACAEALAVSRVSIWVLSENQSELTCLSLYCRDTDQYEHGAKLEAHAYPSYFEALTNSRVIDAYNTLSDSRTREFADSYLKPLRIESMLDATIRHAGRCHGVLCFEMVGSPRLWSKEETVFAATIADLLSQQMLLNRLKSSEARYKALFSGAGDAIFVLEKEQIIDCNPAALTMFKATRNELLGVNPAQISPERQPGGQTSKDLAQTLVIRCYQGQAQHFEWQHQRFDGSLFDADVTLNAIELDGSAILIGQVRDISEKKQAERQAKISQGQLEYRASHDSLTGLPNRDCLHNYVNKLIGVVEKHESSVRLALLLFDLNRFKEVNDTLGHSTGDRVLKRLAKLLQKQLSTIGGRIFRLGGDEFVVVFNSHTCDEPFDQLDKSINQYLQIPIDIDEISLEMSASIGIALFPEHGTDSHELLRCADVAMYHAKNHDGASPIYDLTNDTHSKRRLTMMVELGPAIREQQMVLHFQPKIDIDTGFVTGCEALVRWQHPTLGLVPPGEFLPLAEMSDLIHALGEWVIQNACQHIQRWQNMGYQIPVAVNLSARNLTNLHLSEYIEKQINEFGIPAKLLEIEITESALINHPQRAIHNLQKLDELGVSLAIDDFGTGYSSLSYLKKLPINTLKIDRSFVRDMLSDESDSVIVGSTIDLAHNFSLTVVAEGVENQETLIALGAKRCDQAQGYYIARPMPINAFEHWLKQQPMPKI